MTPATRSLVIRVLKMQEATGRAALADAQQAHAHSEAAAAALAETIRGEQDFAAAHDLATPSFPAWRAAATARLAAARHAAATAAAACDAPREALSETLRTRRGFDTLMQRQDDEHARAAARRDPLLHLMVLAGRQHATGEL